VTAGSDLVWDAATDNTGVVGYNVYRRLTSGAFGGPVNGGTPVTTTTFSNTGLTNGTTYVYAVTAVDAAGNESAKSVEDQATPNPVALAAPGLSPATAGDGKVDLSWTAVTGATAYNVLPRHQRHRHAHQGGQPDAGDRDDVHRLDRDERQDVLLRRPHGQLGGRGVRQLEPGVGDAEGARPRRRDRADRHGGRHPGRPEVDGRRGRDELQRLPLDDVGHVHGRGQGQRRPGDGGSNTTVANRPQFIVTT